jgi:hypothetical protein
MQHAGVGPGGDDGAVGRVLRAVLAEFVQQLGVKVVFAHVLPGAQHGGTSLHGADVGARADLRGAAHYACSKRVLDEAHLVQEGCTGRAATRGHSAPKRTRARTRAQPAVHAGFQPLVRGERVPDGGLVLQQLGQALVQLRDGKCGVHAQVRGRGIRAEADAVPDFALQVFGLAEQRAVAVAGDHQPGVGLGEAAEVVKVAVEVGTKIRCRGCADRSGAVGMMAMPPCAQLGGDTGAARGVEGGGHSADPFSVLWALRNSSGPRCARTMRWVSVSNLA